jgi:protein-L-isoaspartate O-methyltransferase
MSDHEYQQASPSAQAGLRRWLQRIRPRRVLEVGAGVGTLTRVILAEAPRAALRFVEDSDLCLSILYRAVAVTEAQRVHDGGVSEAGPYDFVVIDGGTQTPAYYEALTPRAVVFVEGGRRDQRAALESLHRSRRPFAHRQVKPWDRSKGYHVYQFEPSPAERLAAGLVNAGEATLDILARVLNRCGASIAIGKRRRPPARSDHS